MNGVRIERPSDWRDRSIIAFDSPAPTKSGVAPNLVVTQDVFGPDDLGELPNRVRTYAQRQSESMREQLVNAVVQPVQTCSVAGRAAADLQLSWQAGRVRIAQWITFVARTDADVTIVTATASESEFAEHRARFEQLVASIQFEQPGATARP